MPISRDPVLLGLRSVLSKSLSPGPVRGTESVMAARRLASFPNRKSSSLVCRADATSATVPEAALFNFAEISFRAVVQTTVCLGLASTALLLAGPAMLVVLGMAMSLSVAAAAFHLTAQTWRNLSHVGTQRLAPSLVRFVAGAAIMAGPVWLVADAVPHWLGRSLGPRVGIAAAVLVGAGMFLCLQALWRTPEVGWLAGGLSRRHRADNRVLAEVSNG